MVILIVSNHPVSISVLRPKFRVSGHKSRDNHNVGVFFAQVIFHGCKLSNYQIYGLLNSNFFFDLPRYLAENRNFAVSIETYPETKIFSYENWFHDRFFLMKFEFFL